MTEIWKAIPGLEYYEASNLGRIRSLDRRLEYQCRWGQTTTRFHRGRVLRLKPKPNGCGTIYWSFFAGEDGGYWQVNRAVCLAFNGPSPSKSHEAAHLDGDTNNNRPENLSWSTPLENAAHKIGHGTVSVGTKNGASLLSEEKIQPIFEAYCLGISASILARRYNVGDKTILSVLNGTSWSHVDVGEWRAAAVLRAQANLRKSWEAAARRRELLGPTLRASHDKTI